MPKNIISENQQHIPHPPVKAKSNEQIDTDYYFNILGRKFTLGAYRNANCAYTQAYG